MDNRVISKVVEAGKTHKTGDTVITVLQPSTMDVYSGELTLITGPSGSGKTTLLSLFGCVIYPTSGDAFIVWLKIKVLSENKLAAIRLEKTGCVFQLINLVAPLTSLENVMMPMMLQGIPQKEARSRAIEALTNVGMEKKINKLPRTLSGGEQQRMAIVGALLTNPELVLCDEPTASLDGKSVAIVMEDLKQIAKNGKAVAVGTNDTRLRAFASRRVYVNNGMVSDQPFDETALTKNEKT